MLQDLLINWKLSMQRQTKNIFINNFFKYLIFFMKFTIIQKFTIIYKKWNVITKKTNYI